METSLRFGPDRQGSQPGPHAGIDALQLVFEGSIPHRDPAEVALFRVKTLDLVAELTKKTGSAPFRVTVGYGRVGPTDTQRQQATTPLTEIVPIEPLWRLDQLVLSATTMNRLLDYAAFVEVSSTVFDAWDLRSIEPHPSIALNFRGLPGTGKTMAAHAIAHHLKRGIISCRLSDLESKYHGDGPKNIANLFSSAAARHSVLFIDEAESLLSRRFSQPEQAAESAINSMRTELLMALDAFDGLVIFATNMRSSYDEAIASRLFDLEFELPDADARRRLWQLHLPDKLPKQVDIEKLAAIDGISGRDIKQAVIAAAIGAARRKLPAVTQELLLEHLHRSTDHDRTPAPALIDDTTRARIRVAAANHEGTN